MQCQAPRQNIPLTHPLKTQNPNGAILALWMIPVALIFIFYKILTVTSRYETL